MTRRLVKSNNKMIFGVAGGVADYFSLDPTLVRVGFVVFSFLFCAAGIVAYLAMALLMPSPVAATAVTSDVPPQTDTMPVEQADGNQPWRRRNLAGWAVIGLAVLVAIIGFLGASWGWLAAGLIAVGVVLLVRRSR